MTKKRSKWFPGDQKPCEPGLYQRQYHIYGTRPKLWRWDGKKWMLKFPYGWEVSISQPEFRADIFRWRGLAQPPEIL